MRNKNNSTIVLPRPKIFLKKNPKYLAKYKNTKKFIIALIKVSFRITCNIVLCVNMCALTGAHVHFIILLFSNHHLLTYRGSCDCVV